MSLFPMPISEQIWDMKYRMKKADGTPIDLTVRDTWHRIAGALATAEPEETRQRHETAFYDALQGPAAAALPPPRPADRGVSGPAPVIETPNCPPALISLP